MDDYISKPIQLAELAKVIERNRPRQRPRCRPRRRRSKRRRCDHQRRRRCRRGYDREVIERLVSVAGPTGAATVLGAMIDSAPGMLDGLQRAVATADRQEIRRHAHSLKTNAKTAGANASARQFQDLEQLGGGASIDAAAASTATAAGGVSSVDRISAAVREQLNA